ncbi:MAG TPA: hypothetical protein OIM45_03740 [Clostridiaceae bacterium]|nr:hypothetical protein [Clostridiaceae bacterium]
MEAILSRIVEEVCGEYIIISGSEDDLLAIMPLLMHQTFIYSDCCIYVYNN